MAGAKNHDYHILPPDIWPMVGALSAGLMAIGGIFWMHAMPFGPLMFAIGASAVILTFYSWWSNVITEAHAGFHTPVVQLHLRYGMILFIASEVMFFVGWFWAWFDFSLFPRPLELVGEFPEVTVSNLIGQEGAAALMQWPPKGLHVLNAFELPLLNTMILLCSGTTVTWAHHSLINGNREGLKLGLLLTILLGILFTSIQAYEYVVAPIPFAGLNFGASFYMATGFHGFHVLVGTIFLIVCLLRANAGHFTPRQHFGFEAAAWYWHFVDVVWLFLFIVIYVWGGWGAPVH